MKFRTKEAGVSRQSRCAGRLVRALGLGLLGFSMVVALPSEDAVAKTISGVLTYDSVPPTLTNGLDFDNVTQKPIRGAQVELLDASDQVIDSTTSSDSGDYVFTFADNIDEVKIRVLAETTTPPVKVEDNTSSDALYSMQSDLIDTSDASTTQDLNAASGRSGNMYTGPRVAAPFAILDACFQAALLFVQARPGTTFPLIKVNWSINNRPEDGNKANGQIGTSHYDGSELFILGQADVDTDEFDSHVMIHEWGHYFEAQKSRSDSIGGSHGGGDILDPRVAFGEGWGNALSAMIFHPNFNYIDTGGVSEADTNLVQDMEANLGSPDPTPGWFSEVSINTILYDLFDPANEGFDTVSFGLGTIFDIMTDPQRRTVAMTTIFSFVDALKDRHPSQAAAIDALMAHHSIATVQDEFGTGETNDAGSAHNLPVHRDIAINGPAAVVTFLGTDNNLNSLGSNRYLKFTARRGGNLTITSQATTDVDLFLFDRGQPVASAATFSGNETINFTAAGRRTYILVVQGFGQDTFGTYDATINVTQ